MIPPTSESALLSGQKPMELPKSAVEQKKNGTKVMRPSGVVIGEPSVSVAASVLEHLAKPYRLPLTLEQLRDISTPEERAYAALRDQADRATDLIEALIKS